MEKQRKQANKPRPRYFWWVWFMPLQDKEAGASVAWSAEEIGVPEEPVALKTAHSSLIRAGQAMYSQGLLKHPTLAQKHKRSNGTMFTLSLRAPKV